jgi:hypothetical protein
MIVTRDDWSIVRIYLDEPLPEDFAKRLLLEMIQIAGPYGRGHIEAEATSRKDLDEIATSGVEKSRRDMNGRLYAQEVIHFDYVAGHRIKVSFYPKGLLDDGGRPTANDRGLPTIVSRDFDIMYGNGALENVTRVALI